MVELSKKEQKLDLVFAALADYSRRQILVRLRQKPLSISELAEPFSMSFAGVAKHIEVLTRAGLVRKIRARDDGRSFHLELENQAVSEALTWLSYHKDFWSNKLDKLTTFMEEENHEITGSKTRKNN